MREIIISVALEFGSENAISMRELSDMFMIHETSLKSIVQKERMNGTPICSNANGYYLANSRKELEDFVRRMERQSKTRFRTIKALKKTLNQYEGQITFDYLE